MSWLAGGLIATKRIDPRWVVGLALGALAAAPMAQRRSVRADTSAEIDRLELRGARCSPVADLAWPSGAGSPLASWQSVGGCGAGASTGSSAGLKWIGRGVTGGLFNLQCQTSYVRLAADPERPEHHAVASLLLTGTLGERWTVGASVPVVVKYLRDPFQNGADLSNSGIGDVSLLLSRKLGPIGATSLTATVGLPTGQYDGTYKMKLLTQSQQRGFGRPTGSLALDHVADELWGVTVVGLMASWRGGENRLNSYRAPSGSAYAYAGYFLGPLVPAVGFTVSGLPAHDRDQTVEQRTGLYIAAANLSLEWSSDWAALLIGASFPYQYDGLYQDTEGRARSPWGWGPWMVGLGLAFAPF
jgi:hypothetical protein